jgi:hypothetical protein
MNTTIILVGIYVDDLVISNNVKLVEEFFQEMKAFDLKDLGLVTKLGIKIEHETTRGYSMNQEIMILNLIEQFGSKQAKLVALLKPKLFSLPMITFLCLQVKHRGFTLWQAEVEMSNVSFAFDMLAHRCLSNALTTLTND